MTSSPWRQNSAERWKRKYEQMERAAKFWQEQAQRLASCVEALEHSVTVDGLQLAQNIGHGQQIMQARARELCEDMGRALATGGAIRLVADKHPQSGDTKIGGGVLVVRDQVSWLAALAAMQQTADQPHPNKPEEEEQADAETAL